jgi:hypothetical protein
MRQPSSGDFATEAFKVIKDRAVVFGETAMTVEDVNDLLDKLPKGNQ